MDNGENTPFAPVPKEQEDTTLLSAMKKAGEPDSKQTRIDVLREAGRPEAEVTAAEIAKAMVDGLAVLHGSAALAGEVYSKGYEVVGKKLTEVMNAAGTEVIGPAVTKYSEVLWWADTTRDKLAVQAYDRTNSYIDRVNGGFDKAMEKTDKIGWKPLRNLVQSALVLGRSTKEAVAEVNNIVPRFVDTESYGNDIKGTVDAVRGVVEDYKRGISAQRIRSEAIVRRQTQDRIDKHTQKAEDYQLRANGFRDRAQAARGRS